MNEEFIFRNSYENYEKGNYENALKQLNKSNNKDYNYFLLRSKIYFQIKEYSKSIKDLESCLNFTKLSPEPYQLLSKCYLNMFNYEKAKLMINKAEELDKGIKENIEIIKEIENKINENKENEKNNPHYKIYLEYMKNLYENNIYINKLTVFFQNENMRSIKATENIKKNEILIKIPKNFLITLDKAEEKYKEIFTPELKNQLSSPNHCILSFFLLSEMKKEKESKWYFYFTFLPKSYLNFPIFYTNKELTLLKGTKFLKSLIQKEKEIKKDYEILSEKIINFSNKNSYEEFCKIRCIISSRIFGLMINNKKNDIIAPFADLLNHKKIKETKWFYSENEEFFGVISLKNINKDFEVFDCYGRKNNLRYLLNYGFAIENNEDDDIQIEICLNENFPNYEKKINLVSLFPKRVFYLSKNIEDIQTFQFFSFVRFLIYDGCIDNINFNFAISLENEIKVLKEIINILNKELLRYDNSLNDDILYLKENKNKMTFNEYNCYIIRISEKDILNYYIIMCEKCINLFQKSINEIEVILKNLIYENNNNLLEYEFYIKEVLRSCLKKK
jgi:histone-lysine N-methyltransferase SETD3